jgi:hypothetical protein
MRRIHRALDLTAFAQSQTLDGIGREEHVDGLWRVIPLRGTQESKTFFGHLEPAFHDDQLAPRLRRIASPIFAAIFTLVATLTALTALTATLLVVTTIAATATATASALIVALPLMTTVSLMVPPMTTSTASATLTEAALATARTEGALMALLTLRPALLGIALKPGGISSTGAGVT